MVTVHFHDTRDPLCKRMAMISATTVGRSVLRASACLSTTTAASRALSTHVSVIGLHWKTDETRLRETFNAYGKLEKATLITPAHSSMHLWAHLVYSDFEEALEAVTEMNGQELDGRLLRVSITDPPKDDEEYPTPAGQDKRE